MLAVTKVEAGAFEHPGGLHSQQQLDETRKKVALGEEPWASAYKALIQEADKALEREPEAIIDFDIPAFYQDPVGNRKVMNRLSGDAWAAYVGAVAYQLTSSEGKLKYASKAIEILDAWASTNKNVSNADGNLTMVYNGVGLVYAAELLSDNEAWRQQQREEFKEWLSTVYLHSCETISTRTNNWGDWGLLGCIAAHHFLDDTEALDNDIEQIRHKIDYAIESDGHMPSEVSRGKNGIWYTYFALAPLTAASQIAENSRDVDLFNYKGKDGAGIEDALDYLLIHSRKLAIWSHYSDTDLNYPPSVGWPRNLYEAMFGIYGKAEYEQWIEDSRPIMVHGHHYAWALPTLLRTESKK